MHGDHFESIQIVSSVECFVILVNQSACVRAIDDTDLDAVAKSLHKFVIYGKRNKDSVAELLVTLLFKVLGIHYCRLRSNGPKDYVQVPKKHLGYLKQWTPKFSASVEDFTDWSQNAATVVGKAEVKCIYKCIQRTSEYISSFIDGLVEIPTLKYRLFGPSSPFQEGSETRNIIEDGNTTTLRCRDIKKQDQSDESRKGIYSALSSEPITTKENGLPKVGKDRLQ
ncbi:hypothetical protein KY290_024908 [Solanum tuberosum]|uniref:Uncharacterized protein n=1 Tax=Solanum tuberosum TaxID=4113 RepID=A0ABQ7US43_SOLTU|nr:hypothetical protein KY284_023762 [Solanum tuberosum]KAH0754638.1 hypothetical protein KY290_024908 [Solanum tuberosum]